MRFYRDWYRPNLMAVIVVGDIDRDATVAMIKEHFSSLSAPTPERPRPTFDVPDRPGTRYAIVTDKETTATAVALTNLRPARNQGSVARLSRDHPRPAVQRHAQRQARRAAPGRSNPPFLGAARQRALFPTTTTRDEASLEALVANDGVAPGLDALVTELQRVARFGFTATELARAKESMMRSYERSVTESPDRESQSRADEYTRNFLQRRGAADHLAGARVPPAVCPGNHAGGRSTRSSPTGFRIAIGWSSCPRPMPRASCCRRRRSSRRS